MEKSKILIVDDHPFMRTAISDMLIKSGKFSVQLADNGFEAIAYADEYNFDLVLMDIIMPDMDGIETTKKLIAKYPDLKKLVLTGSYNKESVFEILEAGAIGYALKDADQQELLMAIEKVLEGDYYFGNMPLKDIIADFKSIILPRKIKPDSGLEKLTTREKEIIKYISKGLINKEIGEKLFISKRTIDKHRTNILSKLNMNNSAELIAYAAKYGLVD